MIYFLREESWWPLRVDKKRAYFPFRLCPGFDSGWYTVVSLNGYVEIDLLSCHWLLTIDDWFRCPLCDEDLRSHQFIHLNDGEAPAIPPRPAKGKTTNSIGGNGSDSGNETLRYSNAPTRPATGSAQGSGSLFGNSNDVRWLVEPASALQSQPVSYSVEP